MSPDMIRPSEPTDGTNNVASTTDGSSNSNKTIKGSNNSTSGTRLSSDLASKKEVAGPSGGLTTIGGAAPKVIPNNKNTGNMVPPSSGSTVSTAVSKTMPDCPASPAPQAQPTTYHQAYLPQLTPQTGGYYLYQHSQVTPDQPSPATPGYDVTSFLQHQALGVHHGLGSPFTTSQYGGLPAAPLSPGRSGMVGPALPPASPLLPRPRGGSIGGSGTFEQQNSLEGSVLQRVVAAGAPPSPSIPYISPPLGSATPGNATGFGGIYPGYVGGISGAPGSYGGNVATTMNGGNPANGVNNNTTNTDPTNNENSNNPNQGNVDTQQQSQMGNGAPGGTVGAQDQPSWNERAKQQAFTKASPQLSGAALAMQYGRGARTYSFDEMLPPAMLDPQDQSNPSFSPYSARTTGSNGYPHHPTHPQATWGYSPGGDMYNPPQSPLQTRQSPIGYGAPMAPHLHHPHHSMGHPPPTHHHHYGNHGGVPFYQATSPGPPIQTTPSNKGPEGSNLFIFHIPNHFTNIDMYRLFCQYGNLLSVRIMVEKETGRSRGFGFVSYDSPESAALAIKELNGFAIGNKRLKVQHKQIRSGDHHKNHHPNNSNSNGNNNGRGGGSGGGYGGRPDLPHGPPKNLGISSSSPNGGLPPSSTKAATASSWYPSAKGGGTVPGALEVTPDPDQMPNPDRNLDEASKAGAGLGSPPHVPSDKELTGSRSISPLAKLEPLRKALPDVAPRPGVVE